MMMTFRKMFKTKQTTGSSSVLATIFVLNFLFGYSTSQLYEGSECELKDGSLGICKSFALCRWAIDGLNQRVITYRDIKRCSFEGNNEIICCGDERPTVSERPDNGGSWFGGGEDGIYFEDVTFSYFNNRPPVTLTSTARSTSFSHPTVQTVENPMITTAVHRITSLTTPKPRSTSSVTTQAIRPTIRATTQSPMRSTTSSIRSTTTIFTSQPTIRSTITPVRPSITTVRPSTTTVRPSITTVRPSTTTVRPSTTTVRPSTTTVRTSTKPTIHSFWTEWAPNNDVEILPTMKVTSNDIELPVRNNRTSSNLIMSPFLRDIFNEALASVNISTTTESSLQRVVQIGGGFNGESNNDLSFSRQRTTPPTVAPGISSSVPPSRIGHRRSEIACENYTSLSSPFLSFNILGGVPTALGEFPHMAALGFPSQQFGGNEYDYNCGGSIISENYVLTAAHCVTDRNLPTIVRSGKITLHTNDDGVPGVFSTIDEIIPHPSYVPSRRYNDVALIRLSSPIPFGDNIRPACLRSNVSDIEPDVQLIVTGWGRTSVERAERSNVLLKTNLTGMPLESCNASLLGYNANDRSLRNGVNLGQICAHDPNARQDSCEGDSGGPLQIYSPNGMSTIVGVTSFGISCGSALPSVYARVAFYLDWIESIVWPSR